MSGQSTNGPSAGTPSAGGPSAGGLLSEHVREEIDRWVAKFPPDRKRSAVISALHAVQH